MPHSRAVPADLGKRPDNPETGERVRVLDLFCCAGGAALGIRQAFDAIGKRVEIVGVDIKPRPRYPFRFVLGDALEHARRAGEFDFVWASPPCQLYSVATPQAARRRHPDLVARTRDLLLAEDVPFVIENVPGAPLADPILLCGSMFEPDRNLFWDYVQCTSADESDDLLLNRMLSGAEGKRMQVRRHRLFEPHGFAVRRMACEHRLSAPAIEVAGGLGRRSGAHRKAWHAWMAKAALGIPAWHAMSGKETTQCVPPAYAKYILSEFLLHGRLGVVSPDGERIAMVDALPAAAVVHPEDLAKALSDSELVEKCAQGFRDLREAIPYLREARDRFAQPGRRVPVPGNPTWTEWVQTNLHVTVRRVQQLLSAGAGPRETDFARSKTKHRRKLGSGDWRGLLKATERRTSQVFRSVEDPEWLAGAIRDFAQGLADRYTQPGGKLVVSVSVKARK